MFKRSTFIKWCLIKLEKFIEFIQSISQYKWDKHSTLLDRNKLHAWLHSTNTNIYLTTYLQTQVQCKLRKYTHLEDECFQLFLGKIVQLLLKCEGSLSNRLISRIIILFQVRMSKSVFNSDPLRRVKCQHLVQQIQSCELISWTPLICWKDKTNSRRPPKIRWLILGLHRLVKRCLTTNTFHWPTWYFLFIIAFTIEGKQLWIIVS